MLKAIKDTKGIKGQQEPTLVRVLRVMMVLRVHKDIREFLEQGTRVLKVLQELEVILALKVLQVLKDIREILEQGTRVLKVP